MKWAPFARRRLGSARKVGYSFVGESGPKRGDAKHSAEGGWVGLYSVLDGPAASSWQFSVGYDRIEQHYPYDAYCWHAGDVDDDGGVAANIDLVGIEHLGVAGEPLTDYQVAATVLISEWCAKQEGLARFARYPEQAGVWTLAEHKQVSDVYTACPSDRIPWQTILKALGGDDMTPAELARLEALERQMEDTTKDAVEGRDRSAWNLGVNKVQHEQIKALQAGLMQTAVMVVEHLAAHGNGVPVEMLKIQEELKRLGEQLVQLDNLPKGVDALTAKLQAIHDATE